MERTPKSGPATDYGDDDGELEGVVWNDDGFLAATEDGNSRDRREKRHAKLRKLQAEDASTNDSGTVIHSSKMPIQVATSQTEPQHVISRETGKTSEERLATDSDDEFDMFSSTPQSPATGNINIPRTRLSDPEIAAKGVDNADWDDVDGYYKATPGELIDVDFPNKPNESIQFRILGVIGKGVFSTVLKGSTASSSASVPLPREVAIKCVRHNETMAKAALQEIEFLQKLKDSEGVVTLLLPCDNLTIEYRKHLLLVFEYFPLNLRELLQKFGKNVGLSLAAVRSYFGQLLLALSHFEKESVIHADLKPDNILVSEDFSTVKICDLGSAISSTDAVSMITPYLVSRFYRAPEVVLGLVPTSAIDMWSLSTTMGELFSGKVMFSGRSNNEMILKFMEAMGPIPNRLIRQHLVQGNKHPIPIHFAQNLASFSFRQETIDPISNQRVHKFLSLKDFHPNLKAMMLKVKSSRDNRVLLTHFCDLLSQSLALDPEKRVSPKSALRHQFFRQEA